MSNSKIRIAEKVSPRHPDKIADRITGALVDLCYARNSAPKCAFEVLIGHGKCFVIGETSVHITDAEVREIAWRISGEKPAVEYVEVPQDPLLAGAQNREIVCGDNGIFYGFFVPANSAHAECSRIMKRIFAKFPFDAKIVLNNKKLIISLSNVESTKTLPVLQKMFPNYEISLNQIGDWHGGINVDTGLTGRKLANDFYGLEAPLGGGNMHGKDLSKADVTLNYLCYKYAQKFRENVSCACSIGDESVEFVFDSGRRISRKFADCVREVREDIPSFEEFAKWGLE